MHHLKRPLVSVVAVAALIFVSCADNITAPSTSEAGAATSIATTSGAESTSAPTTEEATDTTAAPETTPPEDTAPSDTTQPNITVAPPPTGEDANDAVIAYADIFQSDVDALTLVFYQNLPGGTIPAENCQEVLDATASRRAALAGQTDGVPDDLVSATDQWYGDMEVFVEPCATGEQEYEVPAVSENLPDAEPAFTLAESYGWERCEGEVCE